MVVGYPKGDIKEMCRLNRDGEMRTEISSTEPMNLTDVALWFCPLTEKLTNRNRVTVNGNTLSENLICSFCSLFMVFC